MYSAIFALGFLAWHLTQHGLNILLCEPCRSDNAQLRLDRPKMLWTIADNHQCLLYCATRDLGRPIDKFIGV